MWSSISPVSPFPRSHVGLLHCRCLQPAFPQRHFIQCDRCDRWFHTSCVGVDSRKLACIVSFVCPWCGDRTHTEELAEEEERPCVCPLCKRVFPRPCNLSRHLHAKHNMKWNTHVLLHMVFDDYLDQEKPKTPAKLTPIDRPLRLVCDGCYAAPGSDKYRMDKAQFRFLLRKLRMKPAQWWVGKEVRIWDVKKKQYMAGCIRSIRPRNEFCVRLSNGTSNYLSNLFDPVRKVRLLILNGCFELELFRAFPTPAQRSIANDIKLFTS